MASPAPEATARRPLTFAIGMTGERFEYLTSARGAAGHFSFRWTLAAGSKGPPEHVHPDETETFALERGALHVWIDDAHHLLRPGDRVSAPPRARHRFRNDGPEDAVVLVSFDGARNEDAHVPVAAHLDGRSPSVGEALRMLVHDAEVGASAATSAPLNLLLQGIAAVVRRFGVRRFPAREHW